MADVLFGDWDHIIGCARACGDNAKNSPNGREDSFFWKLACQSYLDSFISGTLNYALPSEVGLPSVVASSSCDPPPDQA